MSLSGTPFWVFPPNIYIVPLHSKAECCFLGHGGVPTVAKCVQVSLAVGQFVNGGMRSHCHTEVECMDIAVILVVSACSTKYEHLSCCRVDDSSVLIPGWCSSFVMVNFLPLLGIFIRGISAAGTLSTTNQSGSGITHPKQLTQLVQIHQRCTCKCRRIPQLNAQLSCQVDLGW